MLSMMTQANTGSAEKSGTWRLWIARVLIFAVFACNMQCVYSFMVHPEDAIAAYQLAGLGAEPVARSIGISFLLWNCTYPLPIFKPDRYHTVFGIVVFQQAVALILETWLLFTLGPEQQVLADAIVKFIRFDAPGIVFLSFAFFLARPSKTGQAKVE
jgi:hypothetical protein